MNKNFLIRDFKYSLMNSNYSLIMRFKIPKFQKLVLYIVLIGTNQFETSQFVMETGSPDEDIATQDFSSPKAKQKYQQIARVFYHRYSVDLPDAFKQKVRYVYTLF